MAKDNVPFHSVIFPSTLLGTGQPWTVVNHLCATGNCLSYTDTMLGCGYFSIPGDADCVQMRNTCDMSLWEDTDLLCPKSFLIVGSSVEISVCCW